MCGIFTAVSYAAAVQPARIAAALDAIAHRGPDGEGVLTYTLANNGEVALAHRRLSIFDLSAAGAQPMVDGRGRSITFNGSIFNWPELRAELRAFGYSFTTQTDTEVILAAFDKWGPDCTERFNGFWAFAILDEGKISGKPTLFLSRDRFGIKPLYFKNASDTIVFGSEIAAISAFCNAAPQLDVPELARQLVYQLGDDSDRTIYKDIYEIEPATNVLVDMNSRKITRWRYWSLHPENRFRGNDAEALDRFTELFEDAVKIRLRADREVALTLSGGVDSSAIAVAIGRVSNTKVRAFTSHFPDRAEIDETEYAAIVAKKFGLEHILVRPDLTDIAFEERKLTRHQEVMYKSFSVLVNWSVIREIEKSGVRIFLSGQGGDEMFLGYERYYSAYLMAQARTSPSSVPKALVEIGQNSRLGLIGAIGYLLYFSNTWVRKQRYRRDASKVYSDALLSAAHGEPLALANSLFELQKEEICGSQLRHLLRYDDRTAAAFGTEGRPAFLDHRLVEFAVSLDWHFKIRGGWTKFLVRRYLEAAGLPEIAWRKHKLGYNAPTLQWTDQLLPKLGDIHASSAGNFLLNPGLSANRIPARTRFDVYNLLSTAREMNWSL